MKKHRILLMVHEELVPPEDLTGLTEDDIADCRSEYDVYATLCNLGHDVRVIGIGDQLAELRKLIQEWKPYVVFNLLDDFGGIVAYDHYVVAYLELLRQPYTGCNPRGLMLSRDKVLTKQILAWHRIPTPDFRLFPVGKRFREPKRINFPLFVKSATEDASLGISQASVVDDMQSLKERVEFIHQSVETDALVEEYVEGREIYVGVLGNERLTTFPAWEMHFGTMPDTQARIATRKVKWDRKYQARHGISTAEAQGLDSQQLEHLSRLAKRIYRALHMSGFARMDFRMHADGKFMLLEANANPDLSYGEDFSEAGAAMGIDYNTLLTRIISLGRSYSPEWRMLET